MTKNSLGENSDRIRNKAIVTDKEDLIQIASEIQALLRELERSAPQTLISLGITLEFEALKCIDADPIFKTRIVNSLKSNDVFDLIKLINHPAANSVIKLLINPKTSNN